MYMLCFFPQPYFYGKRVPRFVRLQITNISKICNTFREHGSILQFLHYLGACWLGQRPPTRNVR